MVLYDGVGGRIWPMRSGPFGCIVRPLRQGATSPVDGIGERWRHAALGEACTSAGIYCLQTSNRCSGVCLDRWLAVNCRKDGDASRPTGMGRMAVAMWPRWAKRHAC